MPKFNNLQVLRAFAALNVALFHALVTSVAYGFEPIFFNFLIGWGGNGVDIFFVLSGFIMVYVLNQRNISPSKFFIERLLRIVPLYWVLTLAFLVLFMIAPSAFRSDASAIFTHAIISMCFISQAWLGKLPLLFDGWSLEYEMFFYALLSMGLFFTRKYQTYLFVVVGLVLTSLWFKIDLIVYDFILGMAVGCFICHLNFRQPFPLFFLIIGIGLFFSTLGNNLLLDWTGLRVELLGLAFHHSLSSMV